MNSTHLIAVIFGSSAVTVFLTWLLYIRKHKANASLLEKQSDTTEIANIVKMAVEWRETATIWKNEADANQAELILLRKQSLADRLDFETKLDQYSKQIKDLSNRLLKANKRIEDLEAIQYGKTAIFSDPLHRHTSWQICFKTRH